MLVVTAVAACAALVLERRPFFPTSAGVAWSVVAGLGEGGYFLALALALSRAPMGLAYAISRGGATLLVWPISIALLGERLSALSAVGSVLVFIGLMATAEGRGKVGGLAYAWLAAACIAGYHLAYKQALAEGARPVAVFALALGIALAPNLGAVGVRVALRRLAARPVPLVAAGLVSAASFILLLVALARGGAGLVLTLRNTSVVFAYVLAYAIGERPSGRQIGGGVLIAAGAMLLGWR
jgi:drug/metabolite transporter (DMT)-like permease